MHRVAVLLVAGAVFSIFWGALRAFTEADLRRIIGFATLSRMGMVLVAVVSMAPVALNGGVLLMVASGLAAALLVLLASVVLERTGTVSLRALGGLGARMPRTGILFALGSLAMLGIPGLAAFAAQVMIFFGAYPAQRLAVSFAILMGLLWAGLLIWIAERVFLGATPERFIRLRDAGTLELTCTVTLAGFSVLLGVFPALLTDSISFGVLTLLTRGGG
jgi:NADH-quinone oxidoreductase subunit M